MMLGHGVSSDEKYAFYHIYNILRRKLTKMYKKKTEEDNREKGKLYKPQAKNEEKPVEKPIDVVKIPIIQSTANASKKDIAAKKGKTQEKKKSNLELFKEELRQ